MTALIVLSLAMFGGESTVASATNTDQARFTAAAQVLATHCLRCHNANTTRGGLDISTRESLLAGGATSDAIIPLQPDASPLLTRARAGSMPPEKDGRRLNSVELASLTAWIEQGVPWPPEQLTLAAPASAPRIAPLRSMSAVLAVPTRAAVTDTRSTRRCPCQRAFPYRHSRR